MAKGKTNHSLNIYVAEQWRDHTQVKEWEAKGHLVFIGHDFEGFDLILSPNAWQWNDSLWRYADVVIKEARKRKSARVDSKTGPDVGDGKRPKKATK